MQKRLNIEKPIEFKRLVNHYNIATFFVLLLTIEGFMGTLLYQANVGTIILVLSELLLSLPFALVWHMQSAKIVIDKDGISSKSIFGKKYIAWIDATNFVKVRVKGTETHILKSEKGDIKFTENIINFPYLSEICHKVVNEPTGRNEIIDIPPQPDLPQLPTTPGMDSLAIATVSLILGCMVTASQLQDITLAFMTPLVPISDAAKYADAGKTIKMQGILYSDPVLLSRDGKTKYALQLSNIQKPGASSDDYCCVWSPTRAWLQEGKDEVEVAMQDPHRDYLSVSERLSSLDKNWRSTNAANAIVPQQDKEMDEHLKLSDTIDVQIYNLPQDAPVMVAGKVVKNDNGFKLEPPNKCTTIIAKTDDQLRNIGKAGALTSGCLLGWALLGFIYYPIFSALIKKRGVVV